MNGNTCKIAQLLFNYLYKWETIIMRVNRSLNKRFKKSQKSCVLSVFFPERSCLLWDTQMQREMEICGGFAVTYCNGISSAWDLSAMSRPFSFPSWRDGDTLGIVQCLAGCLLEFLPLLNVFFSSHRRQIWCLPFLLPAQDSTFRKIQTPEYFCVIHCALCVLSLGWHTSPVQLLQSHASNLHRN